jgi:hypothetical protein
MVRASRRLPAPFTLLMGSSPGFGSCPSDFGALFGLAFAPAPAKSALASPLRTQSLAHYAKGTPSPPPPYCVGWKFQETNRKIQGFPIHRPQWYLIIEDWYSLSLVSWILVLPPCAARWWGLRLLVRITFQRLFHPPFGVLFTFPSRYYPLLISAPV